MKESGGKDNREIVFYDRDPTKWRDIVGRCEALNREGGTEKVSKDIIQRRRKRATLRQESLVAPLLNEGVTDENRAAIAMQEEMDRLGFGRTR